MNYRIESAVTDQKTQNEAAQLLARAFPVEWKMIADRNQGFPFEEISFIARAENGKICGHVGVMPFCVADGQGGTLRFAGIASVGVDPQFRGQGIAAALCETAAEWALRNGYDALPLFTGKYGVYSGHGWTKYPVTQPQKVTVPENLKSSCRTVPAVQLSEQEKTQIILFYEQSFSFAGKVMRTKGNSYLGWRRIFREPGFTFILSADGYALMSDGAVVELCTNPGAGLELLAYNSGRAFTLALPAGHPAWLEIQKRHWAINADAEDVYHGESVMIRPIRKELPNELYFSCGDKF